MLKKIKITETNYAEIINKIKDISDKYKLYQIYTVKNLDGTINYSHKSFGDYTTYFIDGELVRKCVRCAEFTNVYEHYFHHQYITDIDHMDSYERNIYEETKPIISIDMGNESVLVVHEGDSIKLLKNGFIVYTKDDITNKYTYINKFFTDFSVKNKIIDIEKEKEKREKEWEEANHQWDIDI